MTLHQIDDVFAADQPTDGWTPVNLAELPDRPAITPNLGGTSLIYPGKRHVFSGPPESAKTLAAYCVLIRVTRTGGTGILIDFEMGPYDARQRLSELGATPDELGRVLYLEPDSPATPQRIKTLIDQHPQLVVIDAAAGAYNVEGLDDNKRSEVERFSRLYVAAFWRNEIATILIDHVVKDAEHRGRFQIGSERKLGVSDVHYGFDIVQPISRGNKGRYKIVTHKDRAGYMKRGHLADLHLDSDPQTHAIAWSFKEPAPETDAEGHFRRTGYMERVSLQLELADEPLPQNEVARRVGGTKPYVIDAIATLAREGFLTITDGPNRSKLLETTRPYREDDPTCNPENEPGGSVVREWFGSGSKTTSVSGGSVVRWRNTPEPPNHPPHHPQNHIETGGWFDEENQLVDSPDLTYLASIEPEELD